MSANNGGPAFPQSSIQDPGMTLRDYFAAKAMQGFAADGSLCAVSTKNLAGAAYAWADAMLAEREKGGDK